MTRDVADPASTDVSADETKRVIRVELPAWYLELVERIENLPENRDGSDKSWVFKCLARE